MILQLNNAIKQQTLLFVMSGKRKRDYKKILVKCLEALTGALAVNSAVIDFEFILWKAFPKVFPNLTLQRYSFHSTEAVWRKIQQLRLQNQYMNKISTHDFCRKLIASPFLPVEHLEPAFRNI